MKKNKTIELSCFQLKVTYKEIDEMIHTVDKNGDGKISYSEFRVMMGPHPLIYNL